MTAADTETETSGDDRLRSLVSILDALEDAATRDSVSVRDILEEIGMRSFAPVILVPALILVSPLSGIFGLPTLGAIFILIMTLQKLMGRRHVWMPDWLKRRQIASRRLKKAASWLRRPCAWVDRHTHSRLTWFVSRPANTITLLTICGICVVIPFLEVLPMVTSFFATVISLFSIGLLARDGLFTVLGYIHLTFSLSLVWWLIMTGTGG